MENNIEKIKSAVSLKYYLESTGYELKKAGSDCFTMPCPFCHHKDCFRVTPSKNLWKCFSCDTGGDLIEFHKNVNGCNTSQAILYICKLFDIDVDFQGGNSQGGNTYKRNQVGNNPHGGDQGAKTKHNDNNILTIAAKYYHETAKTCPGFQHFLNYRKFTPELAEYFHLGYADGNLNIHLKAKGFTPHQIVSSGLARENKDGSLYDYFKYQVIYPTFDNKTNDVIHLKGKGIDRYGKPTGKVWQTRNKANDFFFNWNNTPVPEQLYPGTGAPLYIVDGENDAIGLQRIGLTAWSTGGNISDKQFDVLQALLRSEQDIVLIPDNDTAGRKMIQKFQDKLNFWTLPDKVRELVTFTGNVKCLQVNDKYNDVDEAIRGLNLDIPPEKLPTALNQVTRPLIISPNLKACLQYYHKIIDEHEIKYSANTVGKIVYEYLSEAGSFFVIDEEVFYIYEGRQYQVSANLPFKSLIYQLANINYADKSAKVVWESIQAQCFYLAPHTEKGSWLHTDHASPDALTIYFNLCNKKNEVICISPDKIDKIMNGCNEKSIFLLNSPKTRTINYHDMNNQEMREALSLFFDLFFDNMACDIVWKIYIITLIINSILLNMVKAHGINKFTGHQGSGKTETAGMITALIYGENFVTVGSTASDYTDAALNPVTICDNLEIHNITPDRRDFLLCVATGITRQKRKSGTDTKNIYEKTITQIITTSIESFELPELIERAITIPFNKDHFNPYYLGAVSVENQIIKNRDAILSAIFHLVSKILVNFNDKKTAAYHYLEQNHRNHTKQRLNEHLSCMYIIMEEFINQVPRAKQIFNMHPRTILDEWIKEQDQENTEIMQETNIIVRYLNILADESFNNNLSEYRIINLEADQITGFPPKPFGTQDNTDIDDMPGNHDLRFEATTNQLLAIFDLAAKKYNIKQRFSSVRHLAVRIRNEAKIIESSGWSITPSRRIKGQNLFEISNMN